MGGSGTCSSVKKGKSEENPGRTRRKETITVIHGFFSRLLRSVESSGSARGDFSSEDVTVLLIHADDAALFTRAAYQSIVCISREAPEYSTLL